jgi:hypothetical protein
MKMKTAEESEGNNGIWHSIIIHIICVIFIMFTGDHNYTIKILIALQIAVMMTSQTPQDQSLQAENTMKSPTQKVKNQCQAKVMAQSISPSHMGGGSKTQEEINGRKC